MTTPYPHLNPLPLEYLDTITVNPGRMVKHFEQLLETYEQKAYDRGAEDGRHEARKEIRCSTEDYKSGFAHAQSMCLDEIAKLRHVVEDQNRELTRRHQHYEETLGSLKARIADLSAENHTLEIETKAIREESYESGKRDGAKEALDSDTLEDARQEGYDKGFEAGEAFAASQRKAAL